MSPSDTPGEEERPAGAFPSPPPSPSPAPDAPPAGASFPPLPPSPPTGPGVSPGGPGGAGVSPGVSPGGPGVSPGGPGVSPGGTGGLGAGATAKRPPPPPDPALQHRATAALFVALLSLAGFLGFNVQVHRGILIVIYALLAGGTALWLALTAMRRARRSHTARPRGSVAATAIAGIGISLAAAMLLAFGLFGRQLSGYGQCLSGANTISAQQACYRQFSHALNQEISVLSGLGPHG